MGREVRRVPADWQHPKNERGNYIPLLGSSFSQRHAEWMAEKAQWDAGLVRDYSQSPWGWKSREHIECEAFEEWHGREPRAEFYMPDWPDSERTHFQMYEDVSEGTPISPVMESPEALAQWLADNNASAFADQGASYDAWLRVCRGGWAPSMVYSAQTGAVSGVEALGRLQGDEA
jgi:hypothetical protein